MTTNKIENYTVSTHPRNSDKFFRNAICAQTWTVQLHNIHKSIRYIRRLKINKIEKYKVSANIKYSWKSLQKVKMCKNIQSDRKYKVYLEKFSEMQYVHKHSHNSCILCISP